MNNGFGKRLVGMTILAILTCWTVQIWQNEGNAVPLGILLLLAYLAQWWVYLEQKNR